MATDLAEAMGLTVHNLWRTERLDIEWDGYKIRAFERATMLLALKYNNIRLADPQVVADAAILAAMVNELMETKGGRP